MHKYLQFDIEALDNLKLGKFERDSNNEYTHSYIQGSVIKGAIAWNLIQKYGSVNKKLLNGDAVFYNAYPLVNGKPAIPMIQGYVGDKQEVRSNKDKLCVTHSFNNRPENTIPYNNYEFVTISDVSSVNGYSPKKVENLHINKKITAQSDEKSKIFRYEAVKKGEKFRGYIKVNEECDKDVFEVLNQDNLYFGGSRGSGYGKCKICNIEYIDSISLYPSDMDIANDLYVFFISDAILYYEGKVNTYIPEKELAEILGIEGACKFDKAFSSVCLAATYNTMYKTNTICYTAVSKGSILKYKISGSVNKQKLKEVVSNGVGLRKEDGYGQIAILGRLPDRLVVSKTHIKNDCSFEELNDNDIKITKRILSNIFKARTKTTINRLIIDLMKKSKKPNNIQSQIAKIHNKFENGRTKDKLAFLRELTEYLEHMEKKKDKKVWHMLDKCVFYYDRDKSISIRKITEDFAKGVSNDVFDNISNVVEEGISIGGIKYPVNEECKEILYYLKMEFVIGLTEYTMKQLKEV